jgi:hypothetical protein
MYNNPAGYLFMVVRISKSQEGYNHQEKDNMKKWLNQLWTISWLYYHSHIHTIFCKLINKEYWNIQQIEVLWLVARKNLGLPSIWVLKNLKIWALLKAEKTSSQPRIVDIDSPTPPR